MVTKGTRVGLGPDDTDHVVDDRLDSDVLALTGSAVADLDGAVRGHAGSRPPLIELVEITAARAGTPLSVHS